MEFSFNRDTSPEAERVYFSVLGKMTRADRLNMAMELSDNLMELSKTGIRKRHPDYTEQQVTQAYLKLILEKSLYERIFGENEIEP